MQYSRLLLLINWFTPALLGMVSPAQQIVNDWTLFFDGQLGSAIAMHSLRHLTVYVKQPMNSSSLKQWKINSTYSAVSYLRSVSSTVNWETEFITLNYLVEIKETAEQSGVCVWRTNGQTPHDSIYLTMHMRRAVKWSREVYAYHTIWHCPAYKWQYFCGAHFYGVPSHVALSKPIFVVAS